MYYPYFLKICFKYFNQKQSVLVSFTTHSILFRGYHPRNSRSWQKYCLFRNSFLENNSTRKIVSLVEKHENSYDKIMADEWKIHHLQWGIDVYELYNSIVDFWVNYKRVENENNIMLLIHVLYTYIFLYIVNLKKNWYRHFWFKYYVMPIKKS